ncbi:MAG: beta-phosphoglucomutase [Leptolyngbyaceae cyanobacterium bins.59]|nr:beta-phosphoglucomutase [Leptolyngbyaceae cyanobacterium bins.59]
MERTDWTVLETTEATFNPTQLHHKEAVFTLSNGYLGTRGSHEEGYPGASPTTLIHGLYDDAPIVFTELANCPDWLSLVLVIEGEAFRLDRGKILHYQRWLDLYRGVLSRHVTWRSPAGHTFDLHFERFVSLADPHALALRCQITSLDYEGFIEVQANLNGRPDNEGLLHWLPVNQGAETDRIWLHLKGRKAPIELGMAAQLTIQGGSQVQRQAIALPNNPAIICQFHIQPNSPVTVEKRVTVFTHRESSNPAQYALERLRELPCYPILQVAHESAWKKVWEINDIQIEGDPIAQLAVRFNLFQMLSVAPREDDRVSIPAKMLSGFAYRGHVFWDTEIFILPCLTLTQPDLARNLLTYRYHTLAGARRKAQASGYEGAMYVWESAETGDEVTPQWVPSIDGKNLVRIWCGELEVHISTDVAYAVWQYWQATRDDAWMLAYGAEMILDTAVFWASRTVWNAEQNRYEILDVIGPDEYHERVDNNTFTNRMVQWHLQTALEILAWVREHHSDRASELEAQLHLTSDRLVHWTDIIAKIYLPHDPQTGVIEQFEGFLNLEDIDLNAYEPRTRSMQVILGIEGANQRQVLKQADVLMLLFLLREGAFADRPAYYDRQTLQANWDYYVPRTDHTYGSSLGPPIHAILACELNQPEVAYEHFLRSALVDLADVRGNAAEGIHGASTGGVWQSVVFGFGGIHLTAEGPIASPKLPPNWTRLAFKLSWQGQVYEFDLRPDNSQAIKGVIFDLDGVITDTSEFHFLAWKQLADEEGVPFDREANEALRGVSRRDSLLRLLQGRSVTEAQLQEMMTRKNGYYLDLIRTITPTDLLPGALELLDELRTTGIKVAIGSSSKNAQEVLERLGIADRIDAVADGHCCTHSKPAPDIFLHAAAQLELAPQNCVVVEDAEAGIEAALRAGMRSVGLGPCDRVGAATLVLPNLAKIHWAELREGLQGVGRSNQMNAILQNLSELQPQT